jgi:hypothetical protein
MLADPAARLLYREGWIEEAQRLVAQFRITYDLWASDPAFKDLLGQLQTCSPEFGIWWSAHDIQSKPCGRKRLYHPIRGVLEYRFDTFQSNNDPNLRLALYAPLSAC